MAFLSDLFDPPYYAVIFSSEHSGEGAADYVSVAGRMMALAREADGFLGVETLGSGPEGITVSYPSISLESDQRKEKKKGENGNAQHRFFHIVYDGIL